MTPTKYFAQRVLHYRRARGWTQPELAARCQAAGLEWDRSIIANIERNRRASFTIHELLTLAYVLAVPPLLLLLPLGDAPEVEIVPGVQIPPHVALRWVQGTAREEWAVRPDRVPGLDMAAYEEAAKPIRIFAELFRKLENADLAKEHEHSDRQSYLSTLRDLHDELRVADAAGLKYLPVPRHHLEEIQALGLQPPSGVVAIDDSEEASGRAG